jgi:hypothetical protein
MGKPLGLGIRISNGALCYGVTPIDRVADAIWDAVSDAQIAGWTAKQFIDEVKDAWEQARKEELKAELAEISR